MNRARQTLRHPDPQRNPNEIIPPDNLLVVEGADDFHALLALCDAHKIKSQINMETAGSFTELLEGVEGYLNVSGVKRVGFVADADEDAVDHYQKFCRVLLSDRCGYSEDAVNETLNIDGLIVREAGKPVTGIWVMPDNAASGALEQFIRLLTPDANGLWDYAVQTVDALPVFPPDITANWKDKAYIHSWLAWQEEPGKPIGQAITKRWLDPKAPRASAFIAWLRGVFELPTE